ncbi:peptide chain release factor 1 [Striga asiatica]|uniref:Peptide chain release factor 1 n=1 Tax=Striga asiatica TaxID=4170 RepID=A0A5A7PT83_STRAF|nr:peptide chain release factor 1 [Striga asiatica]
MSSRLLDFTISCARKGRMIFVRQISDSRTPMRSTPITQKSQTDEKRIVAWAKEAFFSLLHRVHILCTKGKLMKRYTGKEIAETVLCEYNKKHVLDDKELYFFGPGCSLEFDQEYCYWWHLNIEARLCRSGPNNAKPLLLFVELNTSETNYLSALSLVAPTDKFNGCQKCWSFLSHPRYGFRAGFDASKASDPKQLLEDDAVKLSQLALQDYNETHGFGMQQFTCTGISMDFAEKCTRWVHVNFEARVGFDHRELLRLMFAEFYLENDDKYVLATLSPAEPEEQQNTIESWTDGYPG